MSNTRPSWCFESTYHIENEGTKKAWGCFETKGLCEAARKSAVKYGSFVDMRSITLCEGK